ncbi:MAG: M56 family metallopeptidase [Paludibacter sp.]|nr:M56 family metallopeptidase [Paludibacter sp.]
MEFFVYLLKVNISVILFYILYRFVFERDTFFFWKRIVLLLYVVFSLFYPLTEFYSLLTANVNVNVEETNYLYAISLDSINISPVTAKKSFSISKILSFALLAVYITGVLYCLFRILIQTLSVLRIVKKSQKREIFGQQVRISQQIQTPFSFFGTIIINDKNYTESEFTEILLHERTHKQQWHSVDVMLGEMLCVVAWFNPLVWRLQSEISLNLEFLTDRLVLLSGCEPAHYQLNLVQLSYQKNLISITNNFNVSSLKKRIIMMKKAESKTQAMLKYALLVPLIACLTGINVSINAQDINFRFGYNPDLWDFDTWRKNLTVSDNVDVAPQFKGGERAMYNFFTKTDGVKIPDCFINTATNGRIYVDVSIDEKGNVKKLQYAGFDFLSGGVISDCDNYNDNDNNIFYQAIIESLNPMPKWKSAIKNGKPIACTVKVPLQYHLSDDTPIIYYLDGKKYSESEYLKLPRTLGDRHEMEILKNQTVDGQKVHIIKLTKLPPLKSDVTAIDGNPDILPEFPGGTDALMKFVSENIDYPPDATGYFQVIFYVKFTVEKDGSIKNIDGIETKHKYISDWYIDEARRIIKLMPKWKSGMKDGRPIAVSVTLPLMFNFNYNKKKDLYQSVEEEPKFPGGREAMYKYIAENLYYPKEAKDKGIQGRVVINCVVEKDGTVNNVWIVRGLEENCDMEAVKVVKSLPKWIPGKQNGQPVRVSYTIPIDFKIQ